MVEKEKIEIGSQEKINIDLGKILEHDSNIDNIIEKEQQKDFEREREEEKINTNKTVTDDKTTVPISDIKIYDEVLSKKIENILEEGLSELYMELPDDKKEEFKKKGEETANKISLLLKEVKIQVKKIIGLIIDWLGITRANKFFIKQTAKIKTDKILELKNKK